MPDSNRDWQALGSDEFRLAPPPSHMIVSVEYADRSNAMLTTRCRDMCNQPNVEECHNCVLQCITVYHDASHAASFLVLSQQPIYTFVIQSHPSFLSHTRKHPKMQPGPRSSTPWHTVLVRSPLLRSSLHATPIPPLSASPRSSFSAS